MLEGKQQDIKSRFVAITEQQSNRHNLIVRKIDFTLESGRSMGIESRCGDKGSSKKEAFGGGSATDTNAAVQAAANALRNDILAGKIVDADDIADKLTRKLGPYNTLAVLELMRSSMHDPRS